MRASLLQGCDLVVVDDGSGDPAEIRALGSRYCARVIRLQENSGPAAARNAGARVALGSVLVFFDSDVIPHPDALSHIAAAFESDPTLDAVMGSYDFAPSADSVISGFRNLLHAHVHHRSAGEASTFWAGCGAVRRSRFLDAGGFDETYRSPSVEDVEFGMRLHRAGGRIVLDPRIQVTHGKQWSLASMLHTDVVHRAIPWTRVAMEHGFPQGLNFRRRDRASLPLSVVLPFLVFLALQFGGLWWVFASGALVAIPLLQAALFRDFARVRGLAFCAACLPLYILHQWAAAVGGVAGLCRWEQSRDRWSPVAAVVFAALIFGVLQGAGGAYAAGFDGDPDEPSHVMTGLLIRDYLAQWPSGSPLTWAEQYYVHYPRVAFGHWPPLFHMLEAAWWLFVPASRFSGMLLIGLLAVAAAWLFYRTVRAGFGPGIAMLTACLLIASPAFQVSADRMMSDMLTLLLGIAMLMAIAQWLREENSNSLLLACGACALCLLVKGTGACLLPMPFLAAILSKRAGRLPLRFWLAAGMVLVGGLAWYLVQGQSLAITAAWAGMSRFRPWAWRLFFSGTGIAIAMFAAFGAMVRLRSFHPLSLAATAMTLSILVTSVFLRAMNEPRHWILALPPLLILALCFLQWLWRQASPMVRIPVVAGACAVGLLWFPWTLYQQNPASYGPIERGLAEGGRVMVAGSQDWQEGPWIVLASLRDRRRPGSVNARASLVLAEGRGKRIHQRFDSTAASDRGRQVVAHRALGQVQA